LQTSALDTGFRRTHKDLTGRYLKVDFVECPVEATLGVLGKKWTILILRDIGMYRRERFNQLSKTLPGIAPRVLASRLAQLEREGFVWKTVEKASPPRVVRWTLTEKGMDAIRIGMMLAIFGSKWNAQEVYEDKRPRVPREIFDEEGMALLTRDF
jgi:DNA-binding HxlR family transcriptional regulator